MQSAKINAIDFVDPSQPVVDSASKVGIEVARLLRAGSNVLVSVRGVRGVSSSFFNVILSAVAEALNGDWDPARFDVDTDTPTQRMIYLRSLNSFARAKS